MTGCTAVPGRAAARGRAAAAIRGLLVMGALAGGCARESVGPGLDATTSLPAEIAAGLYATLEIEGAGGAGGATLSARATLENRSSAPIRIVHGACSLDLHGWTGGADPAAEPPLWRSERRQPWEGTYRYGCSRIAYTTVIQPGHSYSHDGLALRVPILELLGDSLPDGAWDVAGVVHIAVESATGGDAAERPLRTGIVTVQLAVPRPALEARRSFDLITWSARRVSVAAGVLQAHVDGELTHAGGMLLELSADCPLRVHAFATRAERDMAPRAGPALASRPASCGTETRRVSLDRGQVHRLSLAVPVGEFMLDSPAAARYFAVSVHTQHGQVWLDAGSATLEP